MSTTATVTQIRTDLIRTFEAERTTFVRRLFEAVAADPTAGYELTLRAARFGNEFLLLRADDNYVAPAQVFANHLDYAIIGFRNAHDAEGRVTDEDRATGSVAFYNLLGKLAETDPAKNVRDDYNTADTLTVIEWPDFA